MAAENTWVSGSEQSYLDLHPCMPEAGVGRVLVASLHQGIADVLPARLNFYENWLDAEGLREGTIGLAPLYAVLSFLRQEGEAYGTVTTSAGEYAAEWTVESMGSLERSTAEARPGTAASTSGASPGQSPRSQQLPARASRLQTAEGDGDARSARVGLLRRARARGPRALSLLRRGVCSAVQAFRSSRDGRSHVMPRDWQSGVRDEGDDRCDSLVSSRQSVTVVSSE